jgi:protein TonB
MFEDSTFESTGRIKTRSHRWMIVTLAFNGAILVTLVLIPLVYPDALPRHMIPWLLAAPSAPVPETPPRPAVRVRAATTHDFSELDEGRVTAPGKIPKIIKYVDPGEAPFAGPVIGNDLGSSVPGGDGPSPFGGRKPVTVVHPDLAGLVHVPSSLIGGYLIYKSLPSYPVIAKTVGVEGTVVLQATISKVGMIENLRVISGPPMLQQAALDAVKTWRYRPYLLSQQPVEVETTVNVIFKLER